MIFSPPLEEARLIKRYKRFLADIETLKGEQLTIHCANTGAMLNCITDNSPLWFARAKDPKRTTAGSWILTQTPHNRLACINTHIANQLVEEALQRGKITEFTEFTELRREVAYGQECSRIDFYLKDALGTPTYLEVKSVTLGFQDTTIAAFPDAISLRGTKHLRELTHLAQLGVQAALLFCVNLSGITAVRAAHEIDPEYAYALKVARDVGVKILAYGTEITPQEICLVHPLALQLD